MTKSQDNDQVGDSKSPPLKPNETALRSGADQANTLAAETCPVVRLPSGDAGLVAAARQAALAPPPGSCRQRPWLSFFFVVATHEVSLYCGLALLHGEDFAKMSPWKDILAQTGTGSIGFADAVAAL